MRKWAVQFLMEALRGCQLRPFIHLMFATKAPLAAEVLPKPHPTSSHGGLNPLIFCWQHTTFNNNFRSECKKDLIKPLRSGKIVSCLVGTWAFTWGVTPKALVS